MHYLCNQSFTWYATTISKVGRIFQTFCIAPFVSRGIDEKILPAHQYRAIVRSSNADPVVQNGCTIHVWKEKLAVMSIRLFPKPSEVIEKASSLVAVQLAKSQNMSMRLCQCLKLVIATSSSGLSAGMLELPLFFPRASPDNVLSPPHSHWRAVADEPVVLYSRLSGDWPGSVRYSGSDRASTSLCIEPDTSAPSQETIFPGCLPLPEGSESVLASIADGHPDHHQTVWTLPVSKMVLPVNTTISETSEETSVLLLPCDQEPCVAWNYGGRVSLLDLAEMTLSGESGSAERETRKVRKVVQTRDQDGNIVYQWYDQDGHLHTISEWEYKRRLSCIFKAGWSFCTLSILAPLSLPGRLAPVAILESSQDSGPPGKHRPAAMARPASTTPARRENSKFCCSCTANTRGQVHQISVPSSKQSASAIPVRQGHRENR